MTTLKLAIQGMSCGGCSSRLSSLLEKAPGVSAVVVSHDDNNGEISIDEAVISKDQVVAIIEKAGFDVVGG
jgi:copper chaperone CopZ